MPDCVAELPTSRACSHRARPAQRMDSRIVYPKPVWYGFRAADPKGSRTLFQTIHVGVVLGFCPKPMLVWLETQKPQTPGIWILCDETLPQTSRAERGMHGFQKERGSTAASLKVEVPPWSTYAGPYHAMATPLWPGRIRGVFARLHSYGRFQETGAPFGSPSSRHHNILGAILGHRIFGNSHRIVPPRRHNLTHQTQS